MKRRHFLAAASAVALPALKAHGEDAAVKIAQPLKLELDADSDWGDADHENILAVCRSAAEQIWRHCTDLKMPGIFIRRREESPMCAFDHDDHDRVVIYLTSQGRHWSQFSYQFAHEFCHAIAGHSGDWQKKQRGPHPNHWLEESLCECASLYTLRAMATSWKTSPPYPNWADYSKSLAEYAEQRLGDKAHQLPEKAKLGDWLRLNEPAMRKNSTLRTQNTVVAVRLLPHFEKLPAGWRAVASLNQERQDGEFTLEEFLRNWKKRADPLDQAFISALEGAFGFGL